MIQQAQFGSEKIINKISTAKKNYFMFETPVLFIVFNRPEITAKTLSVIKEVKPKYLYIAADGPRKNRPDDAEKCKKVKEVIHEMVDWDCELKTLYREENRGCGHGPAEAITWFFDHVEQGIILEDDCLPAKSFFRFCEELLKKYKDDDKVWWISGSNFFGKWYTKKASYSLSNFGPLWGWATWRNYWENFDYSAEGWFTKTGKENVRKSLNNNLYYKYFSKVFDRYFEITKDDVWDYQFLFSRFNHGGVTIIPSANQITNIGFGENATHTRSNSAINPQVYEIKFPLQHPKKNVDNLFDWLFFQKYLKTNKTLLNRLLVKAVKLYTNVK